VEDWDATSSRTPPSTQPSREKSEPRHLKPAGDAQDTECLQITVEDWAEMEHPHGTILVSIL